METFYSYLKNLSEKIAAAFCTLTFLGTGPSNPIIEKRGKSRRSNSSALIHCKNKIYLIDATPMIDPSLKVDFLFITHLHKDAFGGFKKIKDKKFVLAIPSALDKDIPKGAFEKQIIAADKKNQVGDLEVTPFKVRHDVIYGYTTFGYLFKFKDGSKLLYASDMVGIPKESEKFFNEADVFVVDGAGWKSNLATHFGIWPFLKLADEKGWQPEKIYFTQIGRPVPNHEEAQKEISEKYPRAFLAHDGLKITL